MTRALAATGASVLGLLAAIGRLAIFVGQTVSHLARPPFYFREFGHALVQIGYFSLPVVGLTALFTGGALALQIYAGGSRFDALVTLSTHPMKYLTLPRVLAATLVMPILVGIGDINGIMGDFLVGTERLGFNAAAYLKNTADFLTRLDIISSLVKGAVFGFIAALMGCYYGMQSDRGAMGVGRATKTSVVAAAVLILAANFLLTEAFFSA